MNIDICRKCPYWMEYLFTWDNGHGKKCCVECKCWKYFRAKPFRIWLKNVDGCAVDEILKGFEGNFAVFQEYKDVLGLQENECNSLIMEYVERKKRFPKNCEYKFEHQIGEWNK